MTKVNGIVTVICTHPVAS